MPITGATGQRYTGNSKTRITPPILAKRPYIRPISKPHIKRAMFNASQIKELSGGINADMRASGFWDMPRNPFIIQGLIASEMFEAFEGLRKGERVAADIAQFALDMLNGNETTPRVYAEWYVAQVKDTVEAEIAGTCIRCFDAIGGWLYEGGGFIHDSGITDARLDAEQVYVGAHVRIEAALQSVTRISGLSEREETELFTETLLGMVPAAMGIQTGGPGLCYTTPLASVIDTLKNMCLLGVWFGIDVPNFVALETAYNRTRKRLHGKKF